VCECEFTSEELVGLGWRELTRSTPHVSSFVHFWVNNIWIFENGFDGSEFDRTQIQIFFFFHSFFFFWDFEFLQWQKETGSERNKSERAKNKNRVRFCNEPKRIKCEQESDLREQRRETERAEEIYMKKLLFFGGV